MHLVCSDSWCCYTLAGYSESKKHRYEMFAPTESVCQRELDILHNLFYTHIGWDKSLWKKIQSSEISIILDISLLCLVKVPVSNRILLLSQKQSTSPSTIFMKISPCFFSCSIQLLILALYDYTILLPSLPHLSC